MRDLIFENKRRGLKCVNCGAIVIPTRRQRYSKTCRPICKYCGCPRFDECARSPGQLERNVRREIKHAMKRNDGRDTKLIS